MRTLADPKGRRVALQKGSSPHYLLVQAVRRAGPQWSDIRPIYLPPADARAAFERGAVDAWVICDPYDAAAEIDSQMHVLATCRGLTGNHIFYLASRTLAGQALALVPLVILWFGIDESAKLFLVAVGAFFPICLNAFHGIRSVDKGLIDLPRPRSRGEQESVGETLLPLPGTWRWAIQAGLGTLRHTSPHERSTSR